MMTLSGSGHECEASSANEMHCVMATGIERPEKGAHTTHSATRCRNRRRLAVIATLVLSVAAASPAWSWDQLDIPAELRRPGVRLVVVEFYAHWCKPCKKAVPLWNELHEQYKDRGLRLLVVSVGDGGTCSNPGWQPDKVVCDFDSRLQTEFGADVLPQAFLYSWQGSLLVRNGHFEAVRRAVEAYYRSSPRILVGEPKDQDGEEVRNGSSLREIVRTDLGKLAKFEMVAGEEELTSLRELRKGGYALNYDDASRCQLGREVSANSELKLRLFSIGNEQTLVLQLYSVESGCMLGTSKARVGSSGLEAASFEAVGALVEQLIGRQDANDETRSGKGLSYEELMKKAQELEAQKRRLEEAQAKRRAEIETEWRNVHQVASQVSLPTEDRIAFVEQFLERYPEGNPFLGDAQALLETLLSDGEVEARDDASTLQKDNVGIEWVWSEVAGLSFARTETTVVQYRACVDAQACDPRHHKTKSDYEYCNWGYEDRNDHPMNCVDWVGADAFCRWAGGRLPTEDEWYAEASNGQERKYPWGDQGVTCNVAIWGGESDGDGCGKNKTWPVCSKKDGSSVSGLCDMSGNVWELTSSWFDVWMNYRVARGGSWGGTSPQFFQSSFRRKWSEHEKGAHFGFRCVRASGPERF